MDLMLLNPVTYPIGPGRTVPIDSAETQRVRVSVKALALACLGYVYEGAPRTLLQQLLQGSSAGVGPLELMRYATHFDPVLRGNTALLVGHLVRGIMSCPFPADASPGEHHGICAWMPCLCQYFLMLYRCTYGRLLISHSPTLTVRH